MDGFYKKINWLKILLVLRFVLYYNFVAINYGAGNAIKI
jgi:hypothetical protein